MELKEYQEKVKDLRQRQHELFEEERQLHQSYSECHPWNIYKGCKVRVSNVSGWSEWGYLEKVETFDNEVANLLLYKVKKDGSKSKQVFRAFFHHNNAQIEVEYNTKEETATL